MGVSITKFDLVLAGGGLVANGGGAGGSWNIACYATRADAKAAIQEYIESFYNRQRRHSRLGYVPPALFAEEFSKQQQAA